MLIFMFENVLYFAQLFTQSNRFVLFHHFNNFVRVNIPQITGYFMVAHAS